MKLICCLAPRLRLNCTPVNLQRFAFSFVKPYVGGVRGAVWHKWDLHVHTPASIEHRYGDAQQDETWTRYITALSNLPPEIKAIGINDYFGIDGYRRVTKARDDGLLPNLELVLPVVELRLKAFVGSAELGKLNFHVLFSDELSADDIENFFLRQLVEELQLDNGEPWRGCVGTKHGLTDLGEAVKKATPENVRSSHSVIEVGFASAAIGLETVLKAIQQSVFQDCVLTGLGGGEWNQMRWDGAGAAQKRDAIERVNFVFTTAPSVGSYQTGREKLLKAGVNACLIHASDAHHYADSAEPNRLGATQTWIKGDLSFQGLRRALRRFNDRVFIGSMPPKLEHVQHNSTKYIKRLAIRKREGSSLKETWFDTEIELNHDLVAVIGNQGSGKSALTDILALCGQTSVEGFGFLTTDKFRDPQKRAAEFIATLTWEDDKSVEMRLDDAVPPTSVERVRYVPQGFFDAITNETAVSERGKFYGEIKKVIYSHVPTDDRLGCACLDDLLQEHTRSADAELSQMRAELKEINRRIGILERACSQDEVDRLDQLIKQREAEITTLEANEPAAVPAPPSRNEASVEIEKIAAEIERLRAQVAQSNASKGRSKKQKAAVDHALQALRTEERRFRASVEKIQHELDEAGVTLDVTGTLSIASDFSVINRRLSQLKDDILAAEALTNPESEGSVGFRVRQLEARREALDHELESAESAYHAYLARATEWKSSLASMRGEGANPTLDSLHGLKVRREELTVVKPAALAAAELERREKSKEIFEVLERLAKVHERIAQPVRDHIAKQPLTRDLYQLAFDVRISERGLADRLFALVGHTSGTFAGVQQGNQRLRQLVSEADFTSADGAASFADLLLDRLKRDSKTPQMARLESLLKRGAAIEDVYDLVYSFEYLGPTFELGLNEKPLRRLSPGERGILLLVFYLVVDLGDIPLIIDQPEGNLNNQSIFKHLVPVFMAAKERRQIIIVTHNPNIAVVCDAEQIVHCRIDQDGSHRVHYRSGAPENPEFNALSLDVLEGTELALGARVVSYDKMEVRRAGAVVMPVWEWEPRSTQQ
jgi:ABC-type lipoprotein export system ATPase subunit